jgi:hypothetical protein
MVHERNTETISRLETAGVRVIQVPGSELGSSRGGPRCMSCPVGRDPAVTAATDAEAQSPAKPAVTLQRPPQVSDTAPGPDPAARPAQRELAPA